MLSPIFPKGVSTLERISVKENCHSRKANWLNYNNRYFIGHCNKCSGIYELSEKEAKKEVKSSEKYDVKKAIEKCQFSLDEAYHIIKNIWRYFGEKLPRRLKDKRFTNVK